MGVDVLILNTVVSDFRSSDFVFTDELAGPGGLAKCDTKDMPGYTQQDYCEWIKRGQVTAGGPGNTAPLIAKAGLTVAVGANLGKGDFAGLDAQGRFFYDAMDSNNVDMSEIIIHPDLPTGTTFIYEKGNDERGGIAYFPNANDDFNFECFKPVVKRLAPKVVYYMYSGLSKKGDANEGRDLADFVAWCRGQGCVTIADSHTLADNPGELIDTDAEVEDYHLLEPLLAELDVFFTSYDEARMIENTIGKKGMSKNMTQDEYIVHFLDFLIGQFRARDSRVGLFGVTVRDGVYVKYITADGNSSSSWKVVSRFMSGEVMDLVGAGDSFRAGLVSFIASNIGSFKDGTLDFHKAVQMGNLFASLYIKAPLNKRYSYISKYQKMLKAVESVSSWDTFDKLLEEIS